MRPRRSPPHRLLLPTLRAGIVALALALVSGASALGAVPRAAWVPDELLVGLAPGVSRAEAEALFRRQGAVVVEEIAQIRVHRIRVPAGSLPAAQRALAGVRAVRFVDRNLLHAPGLVPNDPSYGSQWHLPKIGAPRAWDVSQGAGGPVIAILDSGVDPAHPDLAAKLVPGFNVYDNTPDTRDVSGHGTRVAGAAAAMANNATGVAGVAWANRIMPVRVTDTSGSADTSTLAQGLTWAADKGARVMNLSVGGVAGSSTIRSAAQYARGKGALVVASAGNCGCPDSTPENPSIISVSATHQDDARAAWSSSGPSVDVAAPGVSILTTARGGGYASASGTSFASPISAGVIALMMSAKPGLAPGDYEDLLKRTADDKGAAGYDTTFGWGRVKAARTVAAAAAFAGSPDSTPPAATITAPAADATVAGTISVEVTATDDTAVAQVRLAVDGAQLAGDTTAPYSFFWDTRQVANGTHVLVAEASDAAGNVGVSPPVTLTVRDGQDTTPPTVGIASATLARRKLDVAVTAQDDVAVVRVEVNTQKLAPGAQRLEARAYDDASNVGVSAPVSFTR